MSKYSSEVLRSLFKLTARFENPNIERAHSHLSSRIEGGLDDISVSELRLLHEIRRLFDSDDEAIAYIQAEIGEEGITDIDLQEARVHLGASLEGSTDGEQGLHSETSSTPSHTTNDRSRCPNCQKAISPTILRCIHCGHVRALPKKKEGQGCATVAGWAIPLAILVALGFGLKSCLGMFSEESREAVRQERYDNCVEVAQNRAEAACSIDPCDVGCQIENLDDPLAITRCINACREWPADRQEKLCEDAQSTMLWTAIQECPR